MLFRNTKNMVIVGSSHFGMALAEKLRERNTRIVVIDLKEEAFERLPDHFAWCQLAGDGTDVDLLKLAGTGDASVFIAATGDDRVNLMAAEIARRIFNVPEVFAEVGDRSKEKLLDGFKIRPVRSFLLPADGDNGRTEEAYREAGVS